MIRVTHSNTTHKWRKKLLRKVKGYRGVNSKLPIFASEQYKQSLNNAYIGRKLKKRNFKTLWVQRINTGLHLVNNKYSAFIGKLKKNNILLNTKVLSILAQEDQNVFYNLTNLI